MALTHPAFARTWPLMHQLRLHLLPDGEAARLPPSSAATRISPSSHPLNSPTSNMLPTSNPDAKPARAGASPPSGGRSCCRALPPQAPINEATRPTRATSRFRATEGRQRQTQRAGEGSETSQARPADEPTDRDREAQTSASPRGASRSEPHQRPQLLELGRTDTGDVGQLVHRGERPLRLHDR